MPTSPNTVPGTEDTRWKETKGLNDHTLILPVSREAQTTGGVGRGAGATGSVFGNQKTRLRVGTLWPGAGRGGGIKAKRLAQQWEIGSRRNRKG